MKIKNIKDLKVGETYFKHHVFNNEDVFDKIIILDIDVDDDMVYYLSSTSVDDDDVTNDYFDGHEFSDSIDEFKEILKEKQSDKIKSLEKSIETSQKEIDELKTDITIPILKNNFRDSYEIVVQMLEECVEYKSIETKNNKMIFVFNKKDFKIILDNEDKKLNIQMKEVSYSIDISYKTIKCISDMLQIFYYRIDLNEDNFCTTINIK